VYGLETAGSIVSGLTAKSLQAEKAYNQGDTADQQPSLGIREIENPSDVEKVGGDFVDHDKPLCLGSTIRPVTDLARNRYSTKT
jgi:hypothetical protein